MWDKGGVETKPVLCTMHISWCGKNIYKIFKASECFRLPQYDLVHSRLSMSAVLKLLRLTDHLVNFVSVRRPPRPSTDNIFNLSHNSSERISKFLSRLHRNSFFYSYTKIYICVHNYGPQYDCFLVTEMTKFLKNFVHLSFRIISLKFR